MREIRAKKSEGSQVENRQMIVKNLVVSVKDVLLRDRKHRTKRKLDDA